MSFACADLDQALRDGEALALAAARVHAEACAGCRERLEAWDAISAAAPSLRREWESPWLWPAIRARLQEQPSPRRWSSFIGADRGRLLALAASLAIVAAAYLGLRGPAPSAPDDGDRERRLLTERALDVVERSEAEYVASIDGLFRLAEPLLEQPGSPLLANYREKLQLLDAAIAECRSQIERNRFNAHLRRELLSIYQEKQRTLQKLMQERS